MPRAFTILASITASLFCVGTSAAADRPNIVLIMADDVGLGDVSFYREKFLGKKPLVSTPAIDALAKEGMWFTNGHSPTALCSPTRYCVMSGNLNYRSYAPWGVWGSFRESPLRTGEATLGTVAKSGGYHTAFIGKWHLGGDFHHKGSDKIYRGDDRGDEELNVDATEWIAGGPPQLGFDYSLTLPTGIQGPFYSIYENGKWRPLEKDSTLIHLNKETALDPLFVSDKGPGTGDSKWNPSKINELIARQAAKVIEDNAGKRPFFLCYWTPAVHVPHIPPDEINGKHYKGTTPSAHLDMVRVLDEEVNIIVDALKKSGSYDNTLLIFTSDNGGLSDGKGQKAGHNSAGAWRGHKNAPHEGGHRVPFIAVWPGHIKPGTISDEPVVGTDVLATMAAVAGVKVPDDQAKDSLNLLPLLTGSPDFKGRETMLLQGGSNNELIFYEGPWKLIIQSNHPLSKFDPVALFNLGDNPIENEKQNLINHPDHQERVTAMHDKYMQIRNSGVRTAR